MDSSFIPSTTPSSSSSTESENGNSTLATFNRATFLSTYIRHQEWSIPDTIIYYISKDASSAKVYGKLIQSCKYIMIRNLPIVVKNLKLKQIRDKLEVTFDEKSVEFNTVSSKIWPSFKLCISSINNPIEQTFLSILIPKICQSSIKTLYLHNQICSLNDLKFLGSKCEKIGLFKTIVKNENGAIVAFEDIFQIFPNAKCFSIEFGNQGSMMFSPKTFQELVKIPHFLNLQYLQFYELDENFDLNGFYTYMKKNKKTEIILSFNDGISDEYCNRLQAIFEEAARSRDYKHPNIMYPGFE